MLRCRVLTPSAAHRTSTTHHRHRCVDATHALPQITVPRQQKASEEVVSRSSASHVRHVTRRHLMHGMFAVTGGLALTLAPQRLARADDSTILPWTSSVPATLAVKEYQAIIVENRPSAWKSIAQRLQTENFTALAESLDVGAFADLLQAAFYIPWALMQNNDYTAAIEMRKAFNDFESHVLDLQQSALGAAVGQTDASTVQQAFNLMSASMDSYLAAIPTASLQGPKPPSLQDSSPQPLSPPPDPQPA